MGWGGWGGAEEQMTQDVTGVLCIALSKDFRPRPSFESKTEGWRMACSVFLKDHAFYHWGGGALLLLLGYANKLIVFHKKCFSSSTLS